MDSFSGQFKLSITKALGDQLAASLEELTPAPLTLENLQELDRQAERDEISTRSGVYQLYRGDKFVYVGKADKSLSGRLSKHHRKIGGRTNIDLSEISFKCLFVEEDFSALAPERLLIAKHRGAGEIPWNTNGFGNNDPGKRRDGTAMAKNHFDVNFPIDLTAVVEGIHPGRHPLTRFLKDVKSGLPYTFRFEKKQITPLKSIEIDIPTKEISTHQAFSLIAAVIPEGWKISALLGYAIMYHDVEVRYPAANRYYLSGGAIEGAKPELDSARIIEECLDVM